MEFKVALVICGVDGIPFEFFAPAAVFAVAVDKTGACPHFAMVEVPVEGKSDAENLKIAGLRALNHLQKKLGTSSVQSLLCTDPLFREIKMNERRAIFIPFDSRPKEVKAAESLAANFWKKRLALLQEEHPHFDFESTQLEVHLRQLQKPGAELLYQRSHPKLHASWTEFTRKKKILLHICCGPDAAGVINQLKRDFEVVCFWYDPNIQPKTEYNLRLEAFKKVAEIESVPFIEGEYDVDNFLASIQGLEHTPEQGAKCSICYDLRLERSAIEAKAQDCDLYTTTLAISPHKVQEKLKAFGELNEKKYGIPYYFKNFMKDEGFKKSVEYTRDYGIYRQDYCGCWYSLHEGGDKARSLAQDLSLTKSDLDLGNFRVPQCS